MLLFIYKEKYKKNMKILKKFKEFLNENIEDLKDEVANNLEKQENDKSNNEEETLKQISDDINKQIDNINNKKINLEQKIKILTDQIVLIDNADDKKNAETKLIKLKDDLLNFDEDIERIKKQKEDFYKNKKK